MVLKQTSQVSIKREMGWGENIDKWTNLPRVNALFQDVSWKLLAFFPTKMFRMATAQ